MASQPLQHSMHIGHTRRLRHADTDLATELARRTKCLEPGTGGQIARGANGNGNGDPHLSHTPFLGYIVSVVFLVVPRTLNFTQEISASDTNLPLFPVRLTYQASKLHP